MKVRVRRVGWVSLVLGVIIMGQVLGSSVTFAAGEHSEAKPLVRTLGTVRSHVLPAGEVEFSQWWRVTAPRNGSASHRLRSEIEAGLPGRIHLALYETYEITERDTWRHKSVDVEVRWALAPYGELLLNPTLYGEWKFVDEAADKYELKLLLAEDLSEAWWWAGNAVWEQQVGDDREEEIKLSQALFYKIDGYNLAAGVEMQYTHATEEGSRSDADHSFIVGPSVLWKMCDRAKLKAAALFGVGGDSPQFQGTIGVEVELWEPEEH